MSSNPTVTLPPGVKVAPGRETTQLGPNNQNVQGMIFTLTLANGAMTSVFVPYTDLGNVDAVTATFAQRVADISAVAALST